MGKEKEVLAMWRSIDGRVESLKNIDFRCDHQVNVDFVQTLPVDELSAHLGDFVRCVEVFLAKRTGASFLEQMIPTEFVSLFNTPAYLKFYKDMHDLNDLNPAYPFIPSSDKNKKLFILHLFTSSFSLAILFGNRDDMSVWYEKTPLLLYYAACYLFFDYVFDDSTISVDVKKKVVKYVRAIFESKDAVEATDDPILVTVNNIFALLFKFDKAAHPELYQALLDVFNAEAESAKVQNFQGERPAEVDLDELFYHTLVKSRETFNALWNVLGVDYKSDARYEVVMNHFGLVTQMMDDFNDVEADVAENTITPFSYAFIYETGDAYFVEQAVKLVQYVFNLKSELKTLELKELSDRNVDTVFAFFLLALNYAIAKYPVLTKALAEYEHLFPFPFEFFESVRALLDALSLET